MASQSIKKLAELFSKFPTVGQRTAQRFVFYLIKQPKEKIEEIILSIQDLKNKIIYCSFCFNPFEVNGYASAHSINSEQTGLAQVNLCEICRDAARDKSILCIVEKEQDFESIEKTKKYKGLYFILGGNIATLKKEEKNGIRLKELEERLRSPQSYGIITIFKEIIVATNPTPEGMATAMAVEKTTKDTLKNSDFKITHLGLGLPVGGELEYADDETLENAFESRR